jgi:exopolyphosphatase/guanosine-5'-triphosphate,3'-diphosphate pyrophosphatase
MKIQSPKSTTATMTIAATTTTQTPQAAPAATSTTPAKTAAPVSLLDQRHPVIPAPTVPVEQRAGKTTALHALRGLPIGQSFAAIDLGSSSGKMLVAKVTAAGVQVVVDRKIGCALGKDVGAGESIPAANMDRAIDALRAFKDIAEAHGVDVADIPLITTAVVRNAPNGGDFVARVKEEVGLSAKVLSGDEEADVGFRGALGTMLDTPGRYATIDLGGGSFQLAVGTHEGKTGGGSTQVGSNVILDDMINPRVGDSGVVDDAVFAHVDATLRTMAPLPLGDDDVAGRALVATGGVSKFLRIQLGKDVIARDEIDGLRRKLGALSVADRAAFVVVGKDDADKSALGIGTSPGAADYGKKLPASLSLLLHIVDGLGLSEVRVSSTDARHALLNMAIAAAR